MKTTVKKDVENKEEVKEKLKGCFALWKHTSKNGLEYLSGYTEGKETELVGYFNTKKNNPNEPDIRVYLSTDKKEDRVEVASLWSSVSEVKGTKYFTGKTNENEKIVAFYGDETNEKAPYISCYFK